MTIDQILQAMSHPAMPVITFLSGVIFGFLVSRFTLSKSERLDQEQRLYENAVEHKRRKDEAYQRLINALGGFLEKKKSGQEFDLQDFQMIASSGDMYFSELNSISEAILSGRVDPGARDRSFIPALEEAWSKNIPNYYEYLQKIAQKLNVDYKGKFERSNYESIIAVLEKYGPKRTAL